MTGRKPHWLIVEPGLSGHHATYLEHIMVAADAHGLCVTAVLADDEQARAEAARFHAQIPGTEFVHAATQGCLRQNTGLIPLARRELACWAHFRRIYRSIAGSKTIDCVFLPYMDYCLYACGLRGTPFGETPFEGICMRPGFHYREMEVYAPIRRSNALKKYLFARALRIPTLRRLFTNDETLFLYAQRQTAAEWRKVCHFPEPAGFAGGHTRESARRALGLGSDVPVVLVYGSLDERKGIHCLLDGMARPEAPENLVLVLAGKCSDSLRTLLRSDFPRKLSACGRLVVLDRRLSDEEEQMCFVAADICWLGYEGHYAMSGVLVKAVQMGNRIIAGREGLTGWYAARLPQATLTDVGQPMAVADALIESLRKPSGTGSGGSNCFIDNNWQKCERLLFG